MNEYAKYAGPLLALAGFLFQWVRQFAHVKDYWTGVFAALLAVGVYLLCYDFAAKVAPQETIITAILWLSGAIPTVLGGTFAASSAAKAGISAVPMTNSK